MHRGSFYRDFPYIGAALYRNSLYRDCYIGIPPYRDPPLPLHRRRRSSQLPTRKKTRADPTGFLLPGKRNQLPTQKKKPEQVRPVGRPDPGFFFRLATVPAHARGGDRTEAQVARLERRQRRERQQLQKEIALAAVRDAAAALSKAQIAYQRAEKLAKVDCNYWIGEIESTGSDGEDDDEDDANAKGTL